MQEFVKNAVLVLVYASALGIVWAVRRSAQETLARNNITRRWLRRTASMSPSDQKQIAVHDIAIWFWNRFCGFAYASLIVFAILALAMCPS